MKFVFRSVAIVLLVCGSANADQITAVDWTTTTTGTIGSVNLTMTGLTSPFLAIHPNQDFTGPDFSAAPLVNVDSLEYGARDSWTATFDHSLSNLLVYADFWRGDFSDNPDPATNYTFSQSFTILSGLSGAVVTGNTLTLPDGQLYHGIIEFAGPITSLSVVSDGVSESGQYMTFATRGVPEPHSIALLGVGSIALMGGYLRRQRLVRPR